MSGQIQYNGKIYHTVSDYISDQKQSAEIKNYNKKTEKQETDPDKKISQEDIQSLNRDIGSLENIQQAMNAQTRRHNALKQERERQNQPSTDEQKAIQQDIINTLELLLQSSKQTIEEQDKNDGIIAKAGNKLREIFGGKATKANIERQFQMQENLINSLKNAKTQYEFERIYQDVTGVKFDADKIRNFIEAKQYQIIAQNGLAKCSEFEQALKKETITGAELISATQKFFNCSPSEAIKKLNEFANKKGIDYKFDQNGNLKVGNRTYKPNEIGSEITSHKEGDIISKAYLGFKDFASSSTKDFVKNFEKATGKSVLEVSKDYTENAKAAFGNSDFNGQLVSEYCEKQETLADRAAMGLSIAGMTLMVGGAVAAPFTAGSSLVVTKIGTGMAISGTFADEGLDLIDELTSKNGLTSAEGLALLKETATDSALIAAGFATNIVSNGARQLVLTGLGSKVIAKVAEVGVDASLGVLSDAIITGDVSLSGEGLSQAISIITGLSIGKVKTKTTNIPKPQNTPKTNDFKVEGTLIKNPQKTNTSTFTTKPVQEMSVIEKNALGIGEPKKIILLDDTQTPKPKTQKTSLNNFKDLVKESKIETHTSRKYSKFNILESETTTKIYHTKDNNKVIATETVSKDYVHGSTTTARFIGEDSNSQVLQSQTRTYKNSNGEIETHVMELSDIEGVYNSKIIDAKGNEHIECSAVKNADGSVKVEKHLESLNNTKTHQTYEASADGKHIKTFYQITSKDGEILSTIDREFTRISSTKARSSINGYEFMMNKTSKGIEVTDVSNNKTTLVEYDKLLIENAPDKNEIIALLDKMSGDQLLDLYSRGIKLGKTQEAYALFNPSTNELLTKTNIYTYSHELGHAKDLDYSQSPTDYNNTIASNEDFQKIFNREKAEFKKAFPDIQEEYIEYFIKGPWGDENIGAQEAIAEMNAILSTSTGKNDVAIRSYYLQKYFPETMAKLTKNLNPHSNIAILPGTKLDTPSHTQPTQNHKTLKSSSILYDKAPSSIDSKVISAKLKNFNITESEYAAAVKLRGADAVNKDIELLSQLKALNIFKDADLKLEDVPRIYETIKGRAENTIDFNPEDLLSSSEKLLSEEKQFDISLKREISFETAQQIYKSLNPQYHRAINENALNTIGVSKNIVCQEPEIAKAKSISPENPASFVKSLIESNLVTEKLISAYDAMLKSNDSRAKEIADRVNSSLKILTDNSGMETEVSFAELINKAKNNGVDSLTPSEIHAITDVFKNEVRINKVSTEFFDSFFNKTIMDNSGELLPEYKQIAGSVESMKNISSQILGKDFEVIDHAFMRLIDRDLINPTDANGNLVSFRELIQVVKTEVTKASKNITFKNVTLSGIYSSEGKEITLIVKRTENNKIRIESFM